MLAEEKTEGDDNNFNCNWKIVNAIFIYDVNTIGHISWGEAYKTDRYAVQCIFEWPQFSSFACSSCCCCCCSCSLFLFAFLVYIVCIFDACLSVQRGGREELVLDTDSDLGVAFDGRLSMPGNKRKMLKNVYSFDS